MPQIIVGSGGVNRQVKKIPIGVAGVQRECKEAWAGVANVNRKVFSAKPYEIRYGDPSGPKFQPDGTFRWTSTLFMKGIYIACDPPIVTRSYATLYRFSTVSNFESIQLRTDYTVGSPTGEAKYAHTTITSARSSAQNTYSDGVDCYINRIGISLDGKVGTTTVVIDYLKIGDAGILVTDGD